MLSVVPGSERILVLRDLEKIDLSKVVLEIENNIEIEVLKKPNSREYEINIIIPGLGETKYDERQVFNSIKEARGDRDRILRELKKGDKGRYQIIYRGKNKICLYLIY